MSAKLLGTVLLRVWGIILIIRALLSVLPNASMFLQRGAGRIWMLAAAGGFLQIMLTLAAGILLVRNGDRLAAWLLSDVDTSEGEPVTAMQVETIAFSLLGAWLVVEGITHLASAGFGLLTQPAAYEAPSYRYLWDRYNASLVGGVVNLAAGALLIARRQDIATFFSRARPADEEGPKTPAGT